MTEYENQLAHLIQMAGSKGTKEYAWHRALELERCETGMWKGIAEELKQHMLAQQPASLPAPRKRGR
jgi:hypothetical protein